MQTLVKSLGRGRSLIRESTTLVAALIVTEAFYKFGSFTLELVAMLGTWYLLSLGAGSAESLLTRNQDKE